MIKESLRKNGIGKYLKWLCIFFKCCLAKIALLGLKKKYSHVWVFAERGVDARDNALHLFRYVQKECPQVKAFYIISKDSPDRKNFASKDHLVDFGSWKHYLLYLAAEAKVSAHIFGGAPEHNLFLRMAKVKLLKKIFVTGKYIFLQHGVTQADGPWLHEDKVHFDLFITVSDRETKYIIDCFGHAPEVVKTVGFARYDALPLKHSPSKKILLMPTWRHFLSGISAEEFKKSKYYQNICGLIRNERLQTILKEYGYQLIFYPHFELQKFLSDFQGQNEQTVFASFQNFDVQKLMIDCDLMITDYSSVQFDFSYMKKPIVLFQFDRDEYHAGHQGVGYFDPDRDGFGPVGLNVEQTVDLVAGYLERNCELEDRYAERIDAFFKYNDAHNCERNFEAIREIVK